VTTVTADLRIRTLRGSDSLLPARAVEELEGSLRGQLVRPGDDGYDAARAVWNRNIDRQPALVARCVGAADVVTCVTFARDHQLLLAVRGGGHNFSGTSMADRGMVIDLSCMNGVRVDAGRRIARAEGGTKWGAYDRETQAVGLASTGGTHHDTGIAGLTLGGGFGWLGGKHGLALDNLLSVDIVTADGRLRVASAHENADLFWAVRGGGGNFGVVTSFEYQLHPVGPLLTSLVAYPLAQTRDVLRSYHEFASTVPDEVNTAAALGHLPGGGPPVVAIAAAYNGPLDTGEAVLRPLQRFGEPMLVQVEARPYIQVQHWLDPFLPEGQWYETGHFMTDIPDGAASALLEAYANTSSPGNLVIFQQLGNAANRVPRDATAFAHRDARYALVIAAGWSEPAEAEVHYGWARALRTAVAPFATGGVYINMVGREAEYGAEMVRSAFGAHHTRLAALKQQYDPGNLFRHNQNIVPQDAR
jgi:FAD/FMN-containing dehydrogenase